MNELVKLFAHCSKSLQNKDLINQKQTFGPAIINNQSLAASTNKIRVNKSCSKSIQTKLINEVASRLVEIKFHIEKKKITPQIFLSSLLKFLRAICLPCFLNDLHFLYFHWNPSLSHSHLQSRVAATKYLKITQNWWFHC